MPRPRKSLTAEQLVRLDASRTAAEDAQGEFRDVVRDVLEEGASIREVATAARLSPTTVQTWKDAR